MNLSVEDKLEAEFEAELIMVSTSVEDMAGGGYSEQALDRRRIDELSVPVCLYKERSP